MACWSASRIRLRFVPFISSCARYSPRSLASGGGAGPRMRSCPASSALSFCTTSAASSIAARNVVALRNHLRADQHVDLAIAKLRQERREGASAANRVAIEPRDARLRVHALHLRFDPLGAEAGLLEIRACAQRARRRHPRGVVAVVTARAPRVAVAVNHERHAAVRAIQRRGALTAEDGRREAAAVQEHERLLAPIEPLSNRVTERAAE